jgi:lipoprotein-releasing system ATP-binding protein
LRISNLKSQIQPNAHLVVDNLRKSFRNAMGAELAVLRGVSFSAERGEMLAIMGASGAGKSTLLHVTGGLEAADDGLIKLDDFEVTRSKNSELARYRNEMIGFVFQFHHLLPDLTALENVAMPLLISRSRYNESLRRATVALESVGLRERTAHPIAHLSGGEQQRVALARSLIKRPRLILADEPTGNLDATMGDEIGQLIRAYCQEHQSIAIVATHNAHLAKMCDRILVLEEGRIKQESEIRSWNELSDS